MSQKINIEFVSSKEALLLKEKMWPIYRLYFEAAEEDFYKRIESTSLYALYKVQSDLVGFTAVYLDELSMEEETIQLLGLGSTIILPEFRSNFLLQRTCLTLRLKLFVKKPLSKVYFWCHASSYKTYCILAGFRQYYPNHQEELPSKYQAIIDFIGNKKFGGNYDALNQTALYENVLSKDKGNLISTGQLRDPDIEFFHQRINSSKPAINGINGVITVAPMDLTNIYGRLTDFVLRKKRKRIESVEVKEEP